MMRVSLAALGLLALPSFAFAQDKAKTEHTMILATVAPADTPWDALLKQFKKNVEAKTGGKLEVKIKLGGMLGDENETVTKCHRGQIQAVGASTGAIATLVPELHLLELPYFFLNYGEADHVIDTVLTAPYEELFKKRGLILGFWSENGYRHYGTRDKPVHTLADLKGKKMRSQESPVHIAMYKAFGASPVPIPTTEVPQALATGNVDGFDQSVLYALATSWTKSIKYLTLSEHIYQPAAIIYNAKWYGDLPADIQKVLKDEGRSLQAKGRKAVRDIFPSLVDVIKQQRITVEEMSAEERKPFAEVSKKVWKEFGKTNGKAGKKLLDDSMKALEKFRASNK